MRYVFVITGAVGESPEFFVATGKELLEDESSLWDKWGKGYQPASARGVFPKALAKKYRGHWEALEEDYDP